MSVWLKPCPECSAPLVEVFAKDGDSDVGEVMHVHCSVCPWESVDAELGEAAVEP